MQLAQMPVTMRLLNSSSVRAMDCTDARPRSLPSSLATCSSLAAIAHNSSATERNSSATDVMAEQVLGKSKDGTLVWALLLGKSKDGYGFPVPISLSLSRFIILVSLATWVHK